MPRWLLILALCLMPVLAWAEDVAIPPLQHRVTDLTGTLSAEDQAALESRLAAIEQKKGSQVAILLIPTTQPETIEQYAIRVVEAWKLGRKGVDDGVLVLLAKEDRKSRIEVGYGLEGALPDAVAKRITTDIMRPYFRQGDFYGGLTAGVNAIAGVVNGEPLPEPKPAVHGGITADLLLVAFFAALAMGGVLRAVFGKFMGGVAAGGLTGVALFALGAGLVFAAFLGFVVFVMMLAGGRRVYDSYGGLGGFGGMGGGGFGGGGFSGGGGGFGGGGASGDW